MLFTQLDPEQAKELINLKVLAVTRLIRAVLPGMLTRGHGSIVNVSSRLAFSGPLGSEQLPKRATYAGANAYEESELLDQMQESQKRFFEGTQTGQIANRYRS